LLGKLLHAALHSLEEPFANPSIFLHSQRASDKQIHFLLRAPHARLYSGMVPTGCLDVTELVGLQHAYPLLPLLACNPHQVVITCLLEELDILCGGDAPIHDHRGGLLGLAHPSFKSLQHVCKSCLVSLLPS
jgi:hypothetical protein